jgi:hypothetical protein
MVATHEFALEFLGIGDPQRLGSLHGIERAQIPEFFFGEHSFVH